MEFRSIERCDKIFVVCCVLHNMLLDDVSNEDLEAVGRGQPFPGEAIWLEGPSDRNKR